MFTRSVILATLATLVTAGCGTESGVRAFVGGRIIDGTGNPPIDDGVLIVRDGRVEAAGPPSSVDIPSGAEQVDVSGRTIMPGLINAHGHVGGTLGLESGHYTEENLLRQLRLCCGNSGSMPGMGSQRSTALVATRKQASSCVMHRTPPLSNGQGSLRLVEW